METTRKPASKALVRAIAERLATTTDTYTEIAEDEGVSRGFVNTISIGRRWVSITGGPIKRPKGTAAVAKRHVARELRAAAAKAREFRKAEKKRLKFRVADCQAARLANMAVAIERLGMDWKDARAQKVLLAAVGDDLKPRIAAEMLGMDRDKWKHAISNGGMIQRVVLKLIEMAETPIASSGDVWVG